MPQGKGVGAELEDVRLGVAAIEPVTEDGAAEALGMGGVDAELVGAAGVGREAHFQGAVGVGGEDFVFRQGAFAFLGVHFLPGAVVPVRGDRQVDPAAGAGGEVAGIWQGSEEGRPVGLADFASGEFFLLFQNQLIHT